MISSYLILSFFCFPCLNFLFIPYFLLLFSIFIYVNLLPLSSYFTLLLFFFSFILLPFSFFLFPLTLFDWFYLNSILYRFRLFHLFNFILLFFCLLIFFIVRQVSPLMSSAVTSSCHIFASGVILGDTFLTCHPNCFLYCSKYRSVFTLKHVCLHNHLPPARSLAVQQHVFLFIVTAAVGH